MFSPNEKQKIIVSTEAGLRLDSFLAAYFSDGPTPRSRTYLQKLIHDGRVTVNQKKAKVSYPVEENDMVEICFPEPVSLKVEKENIPLDIVYEDDDVLVINKPRGMVVHPAAGHMTGTLVNALCYHCENLSEINGVLRPGIVHRIDKDTTGLLLVCKNNEAHQSIAAQLKEHSITRYYEAIVIGHPEPANGTIDAPLSRDKKDRKKIAIDPNGKRAVTQYETLENFGAYSYLRFRLETGRTHQIRVHLSSRHHPILGDPVYGGERKEYPLNGQLLHAKTLGFLHPRTKKYMEFSVPAPSDFQSVLTNLRKQK